MTPRDLFTQIAKKWKVFRGMKEQDSQELMRYLFDGIKEEELDLIKKRQGTGRAPKDSPKYAPFIESCFAGKLVSVIVCDACKKVFKQGDDPVCLMPRYAVEKWEKLKQPLFLFANLH